LRRIRRGPLLAFLVLIVVVTVPLVVRWASLPSDRGPTVEVQLADGTERTFTLEDLHALPAVIRHGEAQNQFGNWRDEGTYTGVLLTDLLGDPPYSALVVEASDGYRVTIERTRVENGEYPMVLAYAMDGVGVPEWQDGFRIVVLPLSGRVSNEDYGAVSAGSFWARNVMRIVAQP
jgi:hypothetical protein